MNTVKIEVSIFISLVSSRLRFYRLTRDLNRGRVVRIRRALQMTKLEPLMIWPVYSSAWHWLQS